MGAQKNAPREVLVRLFPHILYVKSKLNIVYEYLKTKIFSRDTNILPQRQWTLNIFGTTATIIGGFEVSLNYPILNFKKTVCPKNVCMRYWLYLFYIILCPTMYCSGSCNWFLRFSYWKSLHNLFFGQCFFSKFILPIFCFYINQIMWIELLNLALSLLAIKIVIAGGFGCIYQVLLEYNFF